MPPRSGATHGSVGSPSIPRAGPACFSFSNQLLYRVSITGAGDRGDKQRLRNAGFEPCSFGRDRHGREFSRQIYIQNFPAVAAPDRLHTTRVHLKRGKLPATLTRFLPSISESYILETSIVDPKSMTMQVITYPFAMEAVPKLPPDVKFVLKEEFKGK